MPKKRKNLFSFAKHSPLAEDLSVVMQLGLTMVGCIAFCFFIGFYLDKWLGTKGVFITIFIILGVAGGGHTVYRQIMDVMKDSERDKKNQDNGVD